MLALLQRFISSGPFMPHGHCYLWMPALVWLHFVSDGLIFLAYVTIPFTLVHIVRRRQDLPFNWIFLCFGLFIIACGATHFMEMWTLWRADYWLAGGIKALTAFFSVLTAILLMRLVPQALAVPSMSDMEQALRRAAEAETRAATEAQRRRDEQEIRYLVDRYRSLVSATGQVIWTNSAEGEMRGDQTAWGALTGQRFEQYQGFGWASALHPDDREPTVKEWSKAVAERSEFAIVHRVRRHDGQYRYFQARAVPVLAPDGSIREWVGSHTDITDQRQAEEDLRHARDAAEAASRTKSLFLANMSHELRTPLNAVIGYSEMLQEEVEELGAPRLLPDLRKIHTAGNHLLGLINDVLDLSKIEAGKMDLFPETFNVLEMVQQVIDTTALLAEKNRNRLTLQVEVAPGFMHADQTKVRQSLFNLLSNACKFTEDGQITVTVARETIEGRFFVRFAVRDTGIGIAPEHLSRLFLAFSQADASTTRKFGGSGLGLALSRRFCQMMGGDISVVSGLGQGSTFTIRLPIRAPQESELAS